MDNLKLYFIFISKNKINENKNKVKINPQNAPKNVEWESKNIVGIEPDTKKTKSWHVRLNIQITLKNWSCNYYYTVVLHKSSTESKLAG